MAKDVKNPRYLSMTARESGIFCFWLIFMRRRFCYAGGGMIPVSGMAAIIAAGGFRAGKGGRKKPTQGAKKAPAPSTLVVPGRFYLIGVIASYPWSSFFGLFAHFHGNLILTFDCLCTRWILFR
ncbi:MAG: hypothetical protein ACI4KN_00615 [Gemmiger sp.]